MPVRSQSQSSFFDPQFLCPDCLVPGTVPWLLGRHRSLLFPPWLLKGWRGEGQLGRDAWPAVVLMTLALLRWHETGMSRLAAERRAKTDLLWRAAAGLRLDEAAPSERTMRDFEKFLAERHPDCDVPRYAVFLGHVVRLCLGEGVVDKPNWMIDSTPMWCFGATLDTLRLIGDGTGIALRAWARAVGRPWRTLATELELPWTVAKSTKGHFEVTNWKAEDARSKVVTELAEGAVRLVKHIRAGIRDVKPSRRGRLLRHCRVLLKIIESDLEESPDGGLKVARGTAAHRVISFTDPDARHGRKSRKHTFKGFKLHLLGDAISGLITAVSVTPATVHDAEPCPRLVKQAQALVAELERLYGDHAYGIGRNRRLVTQLHGVELIAPPPPVVPPRSGRFGKNDFELDAVEDTAICPAERPSDGAVWHWSSRSNVHLRAHWWAAKTCESCPLLERCRPDNGKRRYIRIEAYDRENLAARKAWSEPAMRREYRKRGPGELLVNSVTRKGARKAQSWGLRAANTQAHLIAAVVDMSLLAQALAKRQATII